MKNANVRLVYKEVRYPNIKVKPSGEVILTVPDQTSGESVNQILEKRSHWIKKQKAYFAQHHTWKKNYVSGENFEYLGKDYRLKVYEADEEYIKLTRGFLQLFVKDKNDTDRKRKLIDSWYQERALSFFHEIMASFHSIIKQDVGALRIRKMKTRWGSCNPYKSYINLNSELIKKPKSAIEYVIFHELAHLIHHNHDRAFYHFLSLHMPDWKWRKELLEKAG